MVESNFEKYLSCPSRLLMNDATTSIQEPFNSAQILTITVVNIISVNSEKNLGCHSLLLMNDATTLHLPLSKNLLLLSSNVDHHRGEYNFGIF